MKKGYWIDKDGYAIVENKTTGGKKVRQHRLVMEKHLRRKLTKKEIVHHVNGNKLDNRIENLEVCSSHSEHLKKHHSDVWNKGKITINKLICHRCKKKFEKIRRPKQMYCNGHCSRMAVIESGKFTRAIGGTCSVKNCENKYSAKGYCRKHYYSDLYYYKNN